MILCRLLPLTGCLSHGHSPYSIPCLAGHRASIFASLSCLSANPIPQAAIKGSAVGVYNLCGPRDSMRLSQDKEWGVSSTGNWVALFKRYHMATKALRRPNHSRLGWLSSEPREGILPTGHTCFTGVTSHMQNDTHTIM